MYASATSAMLGQQPAEWGLESVCGHKREKLVPLLGIKP
jgi:hypothetical protein